MSLNKYKILAQKQAPEPRSLWRHWPLAVAILPFFGVVAAFGIAPDTVPEPVELQHVVEDIALPAAPAASAEATRYWREERIQRRLELHRNPSGPFDWHPVGKDWVRVSETRLADGSTAVILAHVGDGGRIKGIGQPGGAALMARVGFTFR
jgi:hypothetical protein